MKTKIKYVMAAVMLAIGITSCNDSENDEIVVIDGVPTTMKVNFSQTRTYAPDDANAIDEEINLLTAHIFVFKQSGVFESVTQLSRTDFESTVATPDTYEAKTLINTTTGPKMLIAGINLPSTVVDNIKASGMYSENIFNMAGVKALSDVSGSGSFAMTNKARKDVTVDEDPDNNEFDLDVARMTAKVSLIEKSGLVKTGVSGTTIADISFSMGNVNLKTYSMQKKEGSSPVLVTDPNYNMTAADVAGLTSNAIWRANFFNEFGDDATNDGSTFISINVPPIADITERKAKYVTENTSETKLRGELTYASVRADFTPEFKAKYDNLIPELTNTTAWGSTSKASIFVLSMNDGSYYYFDNQTEADGALTYLEGKSSATGKVEEYKGGYCYYYVILNRNSSGSDANDKASVLRNEYYDVTINNINSLGYPGPTITDPTNPIETDTKLTVDIVVTPWKHVTEGVDLSKD